MFEKASRLLLRFPSSQGALTVEDLWLLPLTATRAGKANLNDVAKEVARQLKSVTEEDFVNPRETAANETLTLMLDIVKHIIQVRQAENAAEVAASNRRAQKARIMELIAQKQDADLAGKSLEELTAMVSAL